jgi:Fe-S cluster assembly protein SufD
MHSTKALDFQESAVRVSSGLSSNVDFVQEKQKLALAQLNTISFPDKKNEAWKYYDFSDILNSSFNLEHPLDTEKSSGLSKSDLVKIVDKFVFRECVENLIVTVNGAYSAELSNFELGNPGIRILNFNSQQDIKNNPWAIEKCKKLFAKDIEKEDKYFKVLNTLLFGNGFFLDIAANHIQKSPLQILHISNQNYFHQMRSLINAGKNSEQDVLVTYVGIEDSNYFTNAVIECYLEEGAKLKLDKIQNESKNATRLYDFYAKLSRDSRLEFNSFSFGAKSSREDIEIDIEGEGAHASLNGLYVLNDKRKSHHKVTINHKVAHATSEQLFKGLLLDESRAEFNGLIEVFKDAQKTDATQLNNNLLLSPKAHIDSRPQLNILADDVKCSHGSTVGRLNQEELFYLMSRGLSKEEAQVILTYSFCQELIDKLQLKSVKNYAANLAFANMNAKELNKTLANLADNTKFKQSRYK